MSDNDQPKEFGSYPLISKALREGAQLHDFRSGGGLRVVRVKDHRLLGYGEHPHIEKAFDYCEADPVSRDVIECVTHEISPYPQNCISIKPISPYYYEYIYASVKSSNWSKSLLKFEIALAFIATTVWFLYLYRDDLSREYFIARCLVYKCTGICPLFSISIDTLFIIYLIISSPGAVLGWYLAGFLLRRPTHFVVWVEGHRIFRSAGRKYHLLELSGNGDYYLCPLDPTYTSAMKQWLESRDLCADIVEMLIKEFQESCLSLPGKKLGLTDGE